MVAITIAAVSLLYVVYGITGVAQFVGDLVIADRATPELVPGFMWQRWGVVVVMALLAYVPAVIRVRPAPRLALFLMVPLLLELYLRRNFLTRGMRLYQAETSGLALVSFLTPMVLLGLVTYWLWGRRATQPVVPELPSPLWGWGAIAVLLGGALVFVATESADHNWAQTVLFPSYLTMGAFGRVGRSGAFSMAASVVFYAVTVVGLVMDLKGLRASDDTRVPRPGTT
jgi:hypothetical protein